MSILKFKKILEEDKTNKELNSKLDSFEKITIGMTEYSFHLCYYPHNLSLFNNIRNPLTSLIKLDEEDIEYFKNKYFKKLEQEKLKEIQKIEKEYNL